MKKKYMRPEILYVVETGTFLLSGLSGNGVTGNTPDGQIGYGGVDEGGIVDPDAKPCIIFDPWEEQKPNLIYDVWNDEE